MLEKKQLAPDFSSPDQGGNVINLSDYRNNKRELSCLLFVFFQTCESTQRQYTSRSKCHITKKSSGNCSVQLLDLSDH